MINVQYSENVSIQQPSSDVFLLKINDVKVYQYLLIQCEKEFGWERLIQKTQNFLNGDIEYKINFVQITQMLSLKMYMKEVNQFLAQLEKFAKDNNITLGKGWKVDFARLVKNSLLKIKKESLTEIYINRWKNLFSHISSEQ